MKRKWEREEKPETGTPEKGKTRNPKPPNRKPVVKPTEGGLKRPKSHAYPESDQEPDPTSEKLSIAALKAPSLPHPRRGSTP